MCLHEILRYCVKELALSGLDWIRTSRLSNLGHCAIGCVTNCVAFQAKFCMNQPQASKHVKGV